MNLSLSRLLLPASLLPVSLLPVSLLLALSTPAYAQTKTAEVPLAQAWQAANAAPRGGERLWWQDFGDPALDRLIAQALSAGPDLAAAMARIDQAQAASRAAGAGRLPSGSVDGSLARAEQSLQSGLGQLSRYVPTIQRTQDAASLRASLGWDLDLGGGLSQSAKAARADLVASKAALAATRLALAAQVVGQYLALREAEAQARVLEGQRKDMALRLHYADLRLARGESAARERDERQRDLGAIEAAQPLLNARISAARHALAVLTGRPAGSHLPELDGPELDGPEPDGLPLAAHIPLAGDPAAGTPEDMLRARPDLVLAEARMVGAKARVKIALGEYWPRITLGGLLGFDTNTLASFGSPASRSAQAFVGLRWRIFDFARINAEVSAARGAEREALAAYRDAVLQAGEQVESAFALAEARRKALAAQDQRYVAAQSLWVKVQAAHRLGEISEDQLRGESLQLATIEADRITARRALAEAILDCHRALGG